MQAHPRADQALVDAIHDAIETWSQALDDCFDGAITLEDVTDAPGNPHKNADIVVHYVPRAGGRVWGGYSVCGDHGCPNVIVRSDLPLPSGYGSYSPELLQWIAQHEIGHALGVGHATNLFETNDLMGYGWADLANLGVPVLSQCDIEAVAFVFDWVFEGEDPHPPGPGPYVCDG